MVLENPSEPAFDAALDKNAVVFVDFYATWCAPCKSYSPKFSRAYREVKRQRPKVPVEFVLVDIDTNHVLANRFRVKAVPTTVVVTKKKNWLGRVKDHETLRFSGDRSWNDLVRSLLAAIDDRPK